MLLPDIGRAVDRLLRAKRDGEVVAVFGDFDVDGLTGTALLVEAFSGLGVKSIPYIPDRVAEGHGLNGGAVTRLRDGGASVMVTVDCGVGSDDEVSLASTLGMDTVITDHHAIGENLPPAAAVVNPSRSDSFYPHVTLTGVGIALKLAQALYADRGLPVPDRLFELAALGTVADVAPLTGENRYIVKTGLECMNRTDHPGLKAVVARSGLTPGGLDEESLSFKIIPRLNAAGRLGDASLSLRLLTAASPQEAAPLAAELERLNDERKVLSREAIDEAVAQVGPFSEATPPVLVVESDDWLPGILGLVANSLAERYDRPAVAVAVEDGTCRASARSVPGFDIVEALEKNSGLLRRFGGHPQAAGFSMATADLPRLKAGLEAVAGDAVFAKPEPALDVDCEIAPTLLNQRNLGFLQRMRPFGAGNPQPVFLTRRARILQARRVGAASDHLKMRVGHGGRAWGAIAFKQGDRLADVGDHIDVVYRATMNDWGGTPSLELEVVDFAEAGRRRVVRS
jgi:single-stranded-DNA-specific exonuclease